MKTLLQFFVCLIIVFKTNGADKVIYVRVGDNVELYYPELPQRYYVSWFFGTDNLVALADANYLNGRHVYTDGIWAGKLSLTHKSLTISNIQEKNFGTISCVVKAPATEDITKRFMLINTLVSLKEPLPVIPGNPLSLNCKVETKRQPVIYWINPMGKRESTVQITKTAVTQDNGKWTCIVQDEEESTFELRVSVVDFSPASKHLYTFTNRSLIMPFRITPKEFVQQIPSKIEKIEWFFTPKTSSAQQSIFHFSPNNGHQWIQDRELRYNNFTPDGNFNLKRNQARVEDRGNYNCSIKFTNGHTLSRSVVVEVLQITPTPRTELISGHQLNLSCSTGGPLETGIKVKWVPPKTSSLAKAKPSSGHLVIPRVGTEDSGKWRCELWQNTTLLMSSEIILKIDPILTVWMVVTICGGGVILILLLILGFILFRRRQRKIRQLRHRLCQCKNPKPKGFYKA